MSSDDIFVGLITDIHIMFTNCTCKSTFHAVHFTIILQHQERSEILKSGKIIMSKRLFSYGSSSRIVQPSITHNSIRKCLIFNYNAFTSVPSLKNMNLLHIYPTRRDLSANLGASCLLPSCIFDRHLV